MLSCGARLTLPLPLGTYGLILTSRSHVNAKVKLCKQLFLTIICKCSTCSAIKSSVHFVQTCINYTTAPAMGKSYSCLNTGNNPRLQKHCSKHRLRTYCITNIFGIVYIFKAYLTDLAYQNIVNNFCEQL